MTEILLGPPGTGKTTSLLDILDKELERGIKPDRIGYVSFTRKAAEEAVSRACQRFGYDRSQFPHFRTLHSLCFRALGMKSSDVLEGKKFHEFADYARIRVTGRAWSEDGILTGFESGDRILFMENLARIRMVTLRQQYDHGDDQLNWREVERVSTALAAFKKSRGLSDFTDFLSTFVDNNTVLRLETLLVDEAQDLSALQWRVVEQLAKYANRVVVAGDDDQAIYRWAGADVEHLIDMEGDARVLGQSYRCPPVVAEMALSVIGHVKHRRPKEWSARRATGAIERVSGFGDVDCGTQWRDGSEEPPILILARNAYVIREQIEPMLRREGIVYERNGKSSLDMKSLQAAENWEKLRKSEAITLAAARELYELISTNTGIKRGFKKLPTFGDDPDEPVTMRDLREFGGLLVDPTKIWHEALDRLPEDSMTYMLSARRRGERLRAVPRVRVSTIHSAKGGQADHVVLFSEMATRTYNEMMESPEDEARVWYVGVTRSRSKLTIVNSQTRNQCPWI